MWYKIREQWENNCLTVNHIDVGLKAGIWIPLIPGGHYWDVTNAFNNILSQELAKQEIDLDRFYHQHHVFQRDNTIEVVRAIEKVVSQ